MMGAEPGSMRDLVDVERGVISREIFVSDELYATEQAQIFNRAWLYVGHESQIPRPGDFLASSMARSPSSCAATGPARCTCSSTRAAIAG